MITWQSSIWMAPALVGLSGLVFAIFHSLTASQRVKRWFYRFGMTSAQYRLLYSLLSLLTGSVWLLFVHNLPDIALYHFQGALWWLLIAIQAVGIAVALAAFLPIDGLVFLGLRQVDTSPDSFVVEGIYRYLRHPMYTGAMLFLLAMPVQTYNGLALLLVVCLYFIIGSRLEEARMVAAYPAYSSYQQNVGAFVPHLRTFLK